MKKLFERFKRYIKRVFKIIARPEMAILPGEISFFVVLSFIPMLTLVGLIASRFSISLTNFISTLSISLPSTITNVIVPVLSSPGSISIYSIIFGFYLASNGTHSIIIASNTMFKIDNADWLKRRIKALMMLVILVLLFLFLILVLGFGNTLFTLFIDLLKIKLPVFVYYILSVVKTLVSLLVIYILVKIILKFAPDADIPSRRMTRGALFITLSWYVATWVYSLYVNNFANYNVFYSSLANIVVLMTWIYILSFTLVIGIAVNSENYIYEMKVEQEIREKEQEELEKTIKLRLEENKVELEKED